MPGGDCRGTGDDDGPCADDETQRIVANSNQSELLVNANSESLRGFRNSILGRKIIGIKYIKYYYALSDNVELNLITSAKTLMLMPKISNFIDKMSDTNTDPNEILINEDFSREILELINDSKALALNNTALFLINDIERDLILITNKTKSEILGELEL